MTYIFPTAGKYWFLLFRNAIFANTQFFVRHTTRTLTYEMTEWKNNMILLFYSISLQSGYGAEGNQSLPKRQILEITETAVK